MNDIDMDIERFPGGAKVIFNGQALNITFLQRSLDLSNCNNVSRHGITQFIHRGK